MESFSDKLKSLGFKTAVNLPAPRGKSYKTLEEEIKGREIRNSLGECVLREDLFPFGYLHGNVEFQRKYGLTELLKLARFENLESSIDRFIFLDTETSGLSGGTGTFAFLVGIGRFVDSGFQLHQLIIRDPLEEPAMLLALQNAIDDSDIFVTYNGKSFDLPILINRFRINKQPVNFQTNQHLDLLHVARKIWKDQLPSCGLKEMEREILRFTRTDEDIPGWMIPEIYFEYIRSKDPERISNVIYHNAIDIVSLAALFLHTGILVQKESGDVCISPKELLAIGKAYSSIGKISEAESTYTQFIELFPEDNHIYEVHYLLGLLYKKQNVWEECLPYWTSAAEAGTLEACIELAKYFEHKVRDFDSASLWAGKAKVIADRAQVSGDVIFDIDHRMKRIKEKAGKNV